MGYLSLMLHVPRQPEKRREAKQNVCFCFLPVCASLASEMFSLEYRALAQEPALMWGDGGMGGDWEGP